MKKRKLCIVALISSILLIAISGIGIKIFNHEKWQSEEIHNLISENNDLESQNEQLEKRIANLYFNQNSHPEYKSEGYNYLAIGNSITVHEKCDYWWSESGMAATTADKDYFHIVSSYLGQQHTDLCAYAFNYSIWEEQSNDRSETFETLDTYLSPDLDLITIQLGENAYDMDTFVVDYNSLIKHIKTICPSAEIIMIDNYLYSDKSPIQKDIATSNSLPFADLSEIRDNSEYKSSLGAIVYGDDGTQHIVEHSGVAMHPNDKGMQYIADKVIEKISN